MLNRHPAHSQALCRHPEFARRPLVYYRRLAGHIGIVTGKPTVIANARSRDIKGLGY